MRTVSQGLITACTVALLGTCSAPAVAESLLEAFERMRPALQRQLRSRSVEQRLEALDSLRDYPVAEAAHLIHACFTDREEPVRYRAYDTLLALNGEQEVCDALLELAEKGMNDRQAPALAAPALAAILSSNLPIAQQQARQFLETTLADSRHGPEVLMALADGLAIHAQPEGALPLARLSKTKTFSEHFGVRRAVVEALLNIPANEAVGALIGMLDAVGGEARATACDHLTQVTGQIFGHDAGAWGRWWAEAADTFQYRHVSPNASASQVEATSASGTYYGMPLFAERLLFVLDISGSMRGGRIVAAKRELIQAINRLPDHAHFGIVVFNSRVDRWQKTLVPADAKSKMAAIHYVERQEPQSNTASYDALAAAFDYDTEAIYFLSDGAPTAGKIVAPADIVAAIIDANRLRRISVYTIGICPGFPGSPTDAFLRALAEQNHGQYRRVDE